MFVSIKLKLFNFWLNFMFLICKWHKKITDPDKDQMREITWRFM